MELSDEKTGVSFVLVAYKRKYIDDTVRSIVDQDSDRWELLILDGGADWDVGSWVASIGQKSVKFVGAGSGTDVCSSWNKGLEHAQKDTVVFVGDDDLISANYVKNVIISQRVNPNARIFHTNLAIINAHGKTIRETRLEDKVESPTEFALQRFIKNRIQTLGEFAFNRVKLRESGGIVNFPRAWCSDEATVLREAALGGVCNICDAKYFWRKHPATISDSLAEVENRMLASRIYLNWLKNNVHRLGWSESEASPSSKKFIELRATPLLRASLGSGGDNLLALCIQLPVILKPWRTLIRPLPLYLTTLRWATRCYLKRALSDREAQHHKL
jgi:glycosyltransferase involved in cell wall biosynthesis